MRRALLLILDSLGVGGAPDAAAYGDDGATTLGHIAAACARGDADSALRRGPLRLPQLSRLGLGLANAAASGTMPAGLEVPVAQLRGAYAAAAELSTGKDTPSGHWELAGVPVTFDWGYFPRTEPFLPETLAQALIDCVTPPLPGLLGNKHAPGTDILVEFGEQHLASGKPIVYTSADSVLQIAAHEQSFGLQRLYQLCEGARALVDEYRIARVIARPFVGDSAADFRRTGNRRDYAVPPPGKTLLDRLQDAGGEVTGVGKISDIFAAQGVGRSLKADGNAALFDATLTALERAGDRGLIFTNFVDFDMLYGHRRDVAGYARALEQFDARLPELQTAMRPDDLLIISADHGNDPTWPGTDHTRERVPILLSGATVEPGDLGLRDSFADVGQTLAEHFGLAPLSYGSSLLTRD